MSWLGGKRIAAEVTRALNAESGTRIVVGFDNKLAARLKAMGADVTFVSDVERDVSRATTPAIHLEDMDQLKELEGAVVVGASSRDDRTDIVARFRETIRSQRLLAMVDRVQRPLASRVALLSGLSCVEQNVVGRVVVTVGRRTDTLGRPSLES